MPAERYYTGKPCKRGHLSERWVRTKICIECSKEDTSRWYKTHSKNPGVAEGYRSRGKKWRSANGEKDRLKAANWRKREPEKAAATVERWRKLNPDKRTAGNARRRARKAGAEGSYSANDISELLILQEGKCVYCPTLILKRNRHIDHIMPLVLGGSNDRSNIQILCAPCNLSKGAKHPADFALSLGGQL